MAHVYCSYPSTFQQAGWPAHPISYGQHGRHFPPSDNPVRQDGIFDYGAQACGSPRDIWAWEGATAPRQHHFVPGGYHAAHNWSDSLMYDYQRPAYHQHLEDSAQTEGRYGHCYRSVQRGIARADEDQPISALDTGPQRRTFVASLPEQPNRPVQSSRHIDLREPYVQRGKGLREQSGLFPVSRQSQGTLINQYSSTVVQCSAFSNGTSSHGEVASTIMMNPDIVQKLAAKEGANEQQSNTARHIMIDQSTNEVCNCDVTSLLPSASSSLANMGSSPQTQTEGGVCLSPADVALYSEQEFVDSMYEKDCSTP